ncbi:putative cycloheximide resistance protein [Schizopora paradoxa]|uniref:Putative cycloheximide resistance protein n=1 Tax=Schizopora paradoxa TaxID=27342 RepID=A0A0H2RU55_9AGAM|nr:putative cycloheximide resistance protein [Schizopora paradoxa]
MGLGILEDSHLENVPGTSLFNDDPNAAALRTYEGLDLSGLKHGHGKYAHIVLVPQPSDDPNDPLNWPRWRKHIVFIVLAYGTLLCGAMGPLVTADIVNIKSELGRSVQAVSRALGSTLSLSVGLSTIWWSANYNMLVGARVLQGIGRAAFEFLVGASIADIYFVHERGVPVALWNLSLISGINIAPPITGPIIAKLDWRWCFKLYSIACATLFVLQVFLMPETTYHRHLNLPTIHPNNGRVESGSEDFEKKGDAELVSEVRSSDAPQPLESSSKHSLKAYLESLAIFNQDVIAGSDKSSFGYLLVRPFVACLTPVCFWASLLYGFGITWLTVLAICVAQIFSAEPYFFSAEDVGLTYTNAVSPFICAAIAACLCGPLTDYTARRMSRINNGIFEPEFRLVLVVFYAFFGAMGFFGWGISAHDKDAWIVPVIFFGLIVFGVTIGSSAAIGYVVDSHRQARNSTLGGVIAFKNVLSFAMTFFINDWLASRGILNMFGVVGGVTLFTCILTIPMYIYGKRARSWIHRNVNLEAKI